MVTDTMEDALKNLIAAVLLASACAADVGDEPDAEEPELIEQAAFIGCYPNAWLPTASDGHFVWTGGPTSQYRADSQPSWSSNTAQYNLVAQYSNGLCVYNGAGWLYDTRDVASWETCTVSTIYNGTQWQNFVFNCSGSGYIACPRTGFARPYFVSDSSGQYNFENGCSTCATQTPADFPPHSANVIPHPYDSSKKQLRCGYNMTGYNFTYDRW